MPLIPLALQIIGTLASSDLGGGLVSSITSMLAGPKAEGVADKVIKAAENIFGSKDPKQIELLIQQDKSKAELALKKMDNDLEEYRIQVDDTKSARERDVAVRGMNAGTNTRANVMLIAAFAYLIIVTVAIIWFRKDIPGEILALINMSIGAVLGMLVQAFNFEFGSSRSSGDKTNQMAGLISNLSSRR